MKFGEIKDDILKYIDRQNRLDYSLCYLQYYKGIRLTFVITS